jgi:hypothetical protein
VSDSEDYKIGKNIKVSVNGMVIESPNEQNFIVNTRKETVYPTGRPVAFERELWDDEIDHKAEDALKCHNSHTWETYQGIYESFVYCKHCDTKKV